MVVPEVEINTVKVSVCCAWYNRSNYLLDTLESLFNQDYDSYEIIIVNDGSSDPKVKEILDGVVHPRLRVIHQENTGFVNAISRAIEVATGDYIAIQGAGDISYLNRLRMQCEVLDNNPKVGLVGCYYEKFNIDANCTERFEPSDIASNKNTYNYFPKFGFSHGELMYRKSIYNEAGRYRKFFSVGQGVDLWYRILDISDAVIVKQSLYRQFIFSDGVSADLTKVFQRKINVGLMLDFRLHKLKYGLDVLDLYPNMAFLYLERKREFSKSLFKVLLMSLAFNSSMSKIYWRMLINNAELRFTLLSVVLFFTPFRSAFSRLVLRRSAVYKRLLKDLGVSY